MRHIPLLGLVAAAYLAVAFASAGTLLQPLATIALPSAAAWAVSLGDVLVAIGLLLLYVEILKSTRTSRAAVLDHALSLVVFVACLLCFILAPRAGTTGFALITLMSLIDVVAGFTVTISAARRDIEYDRNP
jgi:hypothetical protein